MSALLEVRASRIRIIGLIGLTCLMVAMCYFCTTLPSIPARVVGWIGVIFFSLGLIVFPPQLFKTLPQVVVDGHGIQDRRSQMGLIEWCDVISVSIGEIQQQKFLCLEVAEPGKYLDRLSAATRFAAQANRTLGFPEITLGFAGLSHSAEEVMRFIRERHLISAGSVADQAAAGDARPR